MIGRFVFLVLLLFSISGLGQETKVVVQTPDWKYDVSFKPAVFTDTARMARITRILPLIDKMYREFATKNHVPGIAFGVVVDGKLVHSAGHGYTNIDKKQPVTTASLFRIASMSKSFTAMAILQLRDQGKLDLDDAAAEYIPELKNIRYPTADAPLITIRHLMTHGAGFPEDNPWGDRQLADSDKELMEFIAKQISFSTTPGIAYEYSNLGFALLGKIITKVSGKRYQDYIRDSIWKPLRMNTSEWEYGNVAANNLAHGYRWINEDWREEELLHDAPDGSWGAMGSMITSIEEFSNYMALHLSAWPPSNSTDNGPLKRSSVREMHYPWRFNGLYPENKFPDGRTCGIATAYCYGLNWVRDCNNKVYVGHSGGLPGFGSQWRILPDYGIGVVLFANRTYAPTTAMNLRVLDTLISLAELKPRELSTSTILEQRKNELVKILPDWNSAKSSGIFAENFFPDYPIDSLRKQARQLFSKVGTILSVGSMRPENQLRGSFTLKGTNGDLDVYFTLSPETPALIQEYRIREIARK
ncbi:MAG: serine hydrolase [Chitinophagaceae bacterium]|nr:serine hydrolase [Chitinophagaceae bacterium]